MQGDVISNEYRAICLSVRDLTIEVCFPIVQLTFSTDELEEREISKKTGEKEELATGTKKLLKKKKLMMVL